MFKFVFGAFMQEGAQDESAAPAFFAIMSAPAATRARTTEAVPLDAAQCSGVRWSRLRAFGFAPARMDNQQSVAVAYTAPELSPDSLIQGA